ncbi:TetR/AcrR family transcriptional regulator [Falsarthrobacter nasiphocae]|uniref:AcrR family transcriptional regulator n=1 Tax=Falsarthrobacter nasiphocae TaxID=189863 RepID=A0AAE4C6C1_9MICC|nr:TetR/AcrR family transcriptional regulator [Falsarthrobacter nasiphocae]MDR6892418.1 AcrR family transcriptional regulator [Falsarthrobacter nasiphocae]
MTDLLPVPGALADERPGTQVPAAGETRPHGRRPARERLLAAAVELLEEHDEASVSTRAITDRAGVTAPTLYHHFGDRDSLLEAAASAHFEAVVAREESRSARTPVRGLEAAWDALLSYGVAYPQFFELLFGATRTGRTGLDLAERLVGRHFADLAACGGLAVAPEAAARSFLAANIGAALMLLADPGEGEDLAVSRASRDGILRSLLTSGGWQVDDGPAPYVSAAIALNATLQAANPQQLSEPEFALFLQWLDRLSTPAVPGHEDPAQLAATPEAQGPEAPSPHHDPAPRRGL